MGRMDRFARKLWNFGKSNFPFLLLSVSLPMSTSGAAATPDGQKVFMTTTEEMLILGF